MFGLFRKIGKLFAHDSHGRPPLIALHGDDLDAEIDLDRELFQPHIKESQEWHRRQSDFAIFPSTHNGTY